MVFTIGGCKSRMRFLRQLTGFDVAVQSLAYNCHVALDVAQQHGEFPQDAPDRNQGHKNSDEHHDDGRVYIHLIYVHGYDSWGSRRSGAPVGQARPEEAVA